MRLLSVLSVLVVATTLLTAPTQGLTCEDGTTVSPGQENDGYCDCADGSDEVTSSACAGRPSLAGFDPLEEEDPIPGPAFVCPNKGHLPKTVFLSFVNDGVCDCCDGSDEAGGPVLPHTPQGGCPNTCQEEAEAHAIAVAEREREIAQGLETRAKYVQTAGSLLPDARAEYKYAVKMVDELREKLAALDARIEAAKVAGPVDEIEIEQEEEEEEKKKKKRVDMFDEGPGWLDGVMGAVGGVWESVVGKSGPGEAMAPLVKERAQVQAELGGYELMEEKNEKAANADFGPDDAFHGLLDKCFTANLAEYAYTVCPYGKADQRKTRGGSGSTSLGTFETWIGKKYNLMVFRNGQSCYNGPQRSLTLSLKCGATEALLDVEEPNKCTYTATLITPAACDPRVFDQ